ncbi:MAG: DegT/DnrJ/EryC1/StrS family aminotransferase [Chloroflexi bacterium]|nr:DegT/DnrJ/EryC1/StrS family aminotransferase [Chloroflexota bacterium]
MVSYGSYDIVNRVSPGTLCRAVFNCVKGQNDTYVSRYLCDSEIIDKGKNLAFFNYGRNALYLLFQQKFAGKEIIFPGFICPTVILAAIKAGVKPNLMDVNLEDFNLDINSIPEEELARADALFVNHTFGVPANMDEILKRTRQHPIYLIEDVAQALFARYKNKYVGRFGDAVLISMYKQVPNINGAILISDLNIEKLGHSIISCNELARLFWLTSGPQQYGLNLIRQRRYPSLESAEFQRLPRLRRPSSLSLSLFATMLPALRESVERKRVILGHYQKRASVSKYVIPQRIDVANEPSGFNFSVRLRPEIAHIRDGLLTALRRQGIFMDRLWHDAPVSLPFFRDYFKHDCRNAQLLAKSVINMPVKEGYQESDVNALFDTLEGAIERLIS